MTAASMLRLVLALLLIGSGTPSTWRSINAVTLAALDLEAAIAFYTSLGLENSFVTERFATMSAPVLDETDRANRLNINLIAVEGEPSSLRPCYAAAVAGRTILYVDDVDAVHAAALAAGLSPLMAPSDAPWGERYFHIDDPSGHQIAIAKPLPEKSQHAAEQEAEAAAAAAAAEADEEAVESSRSSLSSERSVLLLPGLLGLCAGAGIGWGVGRAPASSPLPPFASQPFCARRLSIEPSCSQQRRRFVFPGRGERRRAGGNSPSEYSKVAVSDGQ